MMSNPEKMCHDFKMKIFLYQNKELPSDQMARWQRHLKKCDVCREQVDDISQTISFYKTAGIEDVDDIRFQQMIEKATAHPSQMKWAIFGSLAVVCGILLLLVFTPPKISAVDLSWDYQQIDQKIVSLYGQIMLTEEGDEIFQVESDFLFKLEDLEQELDLYEHFKIDI